MNNANDTLLSKLINEVELELPLRLFECTASKLYEKRAYPYFMCKVIDAYYNNKFFMSKRINDFLDVELYMIEIRNQYLKPELSIKDLVQQKIKLSKIHKYNVFDKSSLLIISQAYGAIRSTLNFSLYIKHNNLRIRNR